MPEKDPKKTDDKAGVQTNTVELTPEMLLLVNALTNAYGAVQKNLAVAQTQTVTTTTTPTGQGTEPHFTGAAKEAVEKFNDIQSGLALKPPLLPPTLQPLTMPNATTVKMKWSIPQQSDNPSGFKIQRAPGTTDPFADLASVPASQTEYDDSTVSPKTTYRYRVVALTDRGEVASDPQTIVTP